MLAEGYANLAEDVQAMLTASNRLTEREIERLQETAAEGRKTWGYLALAAGAIALALAILFSVLIARPIRQLDQAIRQMATADFTHAIEVDGPQDMRYLGQRLEWLRSRLHDLEQQQTRFLRHVSHELKTPLTAVREGVELLRDRVGGALSAEQQEIVRIVRENTLSLQKLIEDLLTYHQTRNMEPQTLGPVALGDIVRVVLREHKLAAFARLVTFDAKLRPAIVVGDSSKIRAIVDNLLSNAIKYSPRSGVVRVELATQKEFAVLDVIDQGPGIDPVDRPHIFDSFYQGKTAPGGRIKGSGLGSRSPRSTRWRTAGAWSWSTARMAGGARTSACGSRSRSWATPNAPSQPSRPSRSWVRDESRARAAGPQFSRLCSLPAALRRRWQSRRPCRRQHLHRPSTRTNPSPRRSLPSRRPRP